MRKVGGHTVSCNWYHCVDCPWRDQTTASPALQAVPQHLASHPDHTVTIIRTVNTVERWTGNTGEAA